MFECISAMDDSLFGSLLQPTLNVGSYMSRLEPQMSTIPPSHHPLQCDINQPHIPVLPRSEPITVKKRKIKHGNNSSAEVISTEEHIQSIRGTPAYFLGLLLDETIIQWLLTEANTNGLLMKNFQPVTSDEMRCFIAVLYLSGYVDVPRRRMLWERLPDAHCPLVAGALQRDRFEGIFTALHMGDNLKDETSRLVHLSPLICHLNSRFINHAPQEEQHSIAECVIPSGPRHGQSQAAGRGLRVWCGCTRTGYCVWVEPRPPIGDSRVENGGAVIVTYATELQRRVPSRYTLVFESRYGDLALMCQLQRVGVIGSGTEREKGACLLNPALGGVDKMECNVGLYRISVRGKRFYSAMLTFVFDVALHNAWQLYRLSHQTEDKKQMDLLAFRRNIVIYYLQHYGRAPPGHRGGRPTKARPARGKRSCPSDARYDGVRHYVVPQDRQTRCARCSAKTTTRCLKCDVGVHVRCFVDYHQRPREGAAGTS